jgi:glycosyltransferase involved in cell wall biosynthesis
MTPKKKILYLITQSELGGAQRYVFDLADNLKNDFEISVALGEPGETGELTKMLKEKQIPYFIIPHLKRAVSPISDWLALVEIVKLIKKIQPNIVHLNSSKISILGSLAVLWFRCFAICNTRFIKSSLPPFNKGGALRDTRYTMRVIYTVHGWVFNEPLSWGLKKFYYWAEKFTALFKDKLICVSEFDYQVALKNKIAPTEKLITIHNGLAPINLLSKLEAKNLINARCALRDTRCAIVSIGNLYKTKGFEYLIPAGKILTEQKIDWQIIIIGEGEEKDNLQKKINELGLTEKIILAGRIDNAAQLLPAFDVYVCSSVKEGLSYTIIEAMQAGLPIVATTVGGNPELITDGQTGILVTAQNPPAIASAIIKILNNNQLKNSLGEQAKQKALSEFSLNAMITKTKVAYRES